MQDVDVVIHQNPRQAPWNKGRLLGAKPPLRTKHVWSIRTKLQVEGQTRDLAMFNLAIDSKLRGCDVVSLKVEDVAPHGLAIDRDRAAKENRTSRQIRVDRTDARGGSMATSRLPAKSPASSYSQVVATADAA